MMSMASHIHHASTFFLISKNVAKTLITVVKESMYGNALGLLKSCGISSLKFLAKVPSRNVQTKPINDDTHPSSESRYKRVKC